MTDLTRTISILFIEDLPSDYELALEILRRGGLDVNPLKIDTEPEMLSALVEFKPDIIISDYSMPRFDGMRALRILLDLNLDIPFIMLTGSKNEETAVECIKAGAADYVLKERMKRLPFAVREALSQAESKRALRHSYHLIRTLSKTVEQSPVSIAITDSEGLIEYVNNAFTLFRQYTPQEVMGKRPRIFNTGHLPENDYNLMWDTLKSGRIWEGEFRNRKRDGTEFWENVIISPLLQEDDSISNFILIMEDVTEKRQILEDLVAAKERAEEGDRLKTAFLHNISHEIRTPMNAIVGFSQFLNDPELLPEDRQAYSELIAMSSNQLLSIISDIVSIATIEAGQERAIYSVVDINSVIRLVAEQYSVKAEGSNILLKYKTGLPDCNCELYSDEVKLTQILSNLVNNAIKFTSKGLVEFGYNCKGRSVEFYVMDTGIGIEPAMHEEIFKRFRQVETTETRQFGGSGLGLSISRAYVELLGGKIWLESTPGKGTTFYFTIENKRA